jgi:hypothetical protein
MIYKLHIFATKQHFWQRYLTHTRCRTSYNITDYY